MAEQVANSVKQSNDKWLMEKYLVSLLRSALRDEPPMPAPKGLNWRKLFVLAERHLVAAALYKVVKQEGSCPEKLLADWHIKAETALRKEILFDAERGLIFSLFDKEGVDYLPLKGILIKGFYPHKGMRQFADNDILYRKKDRKKVGKIMLGLGYEYKASSDDAVDDVFMKEPVYNFEMHHDLFEGHIKYTDYFSNVWDRAVRCTDTANEYRMSNEDFYVYIQAHCYKHYSGNGTGIRSFADLYLIRKNLPLDEQLLNSKLSEIGLLQFDKEARYIAESFFGDNPKEIDDRTFEYVITGGVYGSVESGIENKFHNEGKAKSVWQLIFPPMRIMKDIFPILNKVPVLLPILYVVRWIGAIFSPRKLKKGVIFIKKLFSPKLRGRAEPLKECEESEQTAEDTSPADNQNNDSKIKVEETE